MVRVHEAFPEELTSVDQWVVWRLVKRGERMTKVPCRVDGSPADSSSRATWSSCLDAMAAYVANPSFDGIGFVFSEDDPYVGIDLDECRDPATGDIEPWAVDILNSIDTYVELSPSGKGFHLIGKGKLPPGRRKEGPIEMYDSNRYFTVTGNHYGHSARRPVDIQASLLTLHAETFGKLAKPAAKRTAANDSVMAPTTPALEDQAVIDKILASGDAETFKQFQAGNWATLGYPSQSEGDLALAGMLARHAGPHTQQIDRLFRATGMYRDKWDEMRGADTYGAMTVAKALEGATKADAGAKVVHEMNDRFAVVQNGNQVKILDEGTAGEEFRLVTVKDFEVLAAPMPPVGKDSAAKTWLRSPARRFYSGVIFWPGKDAPGKYNLWRGFAVAPSPGDCSLFRQLVREAICARDAVVFEYVWNYLAHLVQRPWERPEVALVLRGGQGTGKNTAVDTVGALVGKHYCQINSVDQLTGRFNAHMRNIVLLHANEATWGGNKSEAGKLKSIITDAKIPVEMKNQDLIQIDNVVRLVVSSNEAWPVPIDPDDRRFLVLDVSDVFKQDQRFFGALHKQLENGGRQALMHDLLAVDLSAYSPRAKPATQFGADMKIRSADGPTRWAFECLNTGTMVRAGYVTPFDLAGAGQKVAKDLLYEDYVHWCKVSQERYPVQRAQFYRRIKELLGRAMTEIRPAAKPGQGRGREVKFASLSACRAAFAGAAGITGAVKWEPI
jgi:hypothetical protein